MKKLLPVLLLLFLPGCGSEGDDVAVDPGSEPSAPASEPGGSGGEMPTQVPAAGGAVTSRGLVTVMDRGRVELCLGPVAESYPPQCGGPEIRGWDWDDHGQGMFEQQGDVRWGTYSVAGTWDGRVFEVVEAVPGALYDVASPEPTPTPSPAAAYSQEELTRIQEEVQELPGAQAAYAAEGHVLVDVTYDDGSLQAWADGEHGKDVVLVTSLLVDAPRQ